jgi:hypothetical protein
MMNDEAEQFEARLRRQPLKKIPTEWRAEILREANCVAVSNQNKKRDADTASLPKLNWLSTLNHQLSTFFWPHPKAWAGLATVWVFIFVLNFSMRDKSPAVAEKSTAPSPEVLVELKKQQLMFAELVGPRETPDADRKKLFAPRPRSERVEILMT